MLLEVKAVRSLDESVRYGRGRVSSLYKKDIFKFNYKIISSNLMFWAMIFVIQICRPKHLICPACATSDLGS
jgi:hypothetical protein